MRSTEPFVLRVIVGGVLLVFVVYMFIVTGVIAPFLGGYNIDDSEYEHREIHVVDAETAESKAEVTVGVADTWTKRYVGLSNTPTLPHSHGLLFEHDHPGEQTYVMRGMEYPIDIIFIDESGTITTIHEAPPPSHPLLGWRDRYSGTGQFVLEVPGNWSATHSVSPGDRVRGHTHE